LDIFLLALIRRKNIITFWDELLFYSFFLNFIVFNAYFIKYYKYFYSMIKFIAFSFYVIPRPTIFFIFEDKIASIFYFNISFLFLQKFLNYYCTFII